MSDRKLEERNPHGAMKMRLLSLLLAGVLLIPAGAWSQGGKNKSVATGSTKPVIEVLVTSHDFGEVYKQDTFRHAFAVRNKGNADLVIEDVKPG
jgi:hypothetical protein